MTNRRPFRFAVQGGPFTDPDALVEHARHVEQLGYDELCTADHIGSIDPFIPLVIAAAATERLRFGPLVINNELHHPALLARTAATFDQVSKGRLVLGLGTGYAQAEHDSIDVELRPPGERVDRFAESLTVLRALLTPDGPVEFAGQHHHITIDEPQPVPVQGRVPFLIGGHGRRVVGLAGRHADIFQLTGLSSDGKGWIGIGDFDIASLARRIEWLEMGAADIGRDPADIERSVLVQHVGIDDHALDDAEIAERFDLPVEVVATTPFALNGSIEQVVDKIGRLGESLGVTHYVVRDADQFAPIVERLS